MTTTLTGFSTILVADDDADDRDMTRDALRECGVAHDVQFVANGEEALAFLRRDRSIADPAMPVLLLLDIRMPRMNGFEVLSAIRGDPALHHLPVVILSTSRDKADVVRGYDLGVNAYMVKPNTFGELVEAMHSLERFWLRTARLPGNALTEGGA